MSLPTEFRIGDTENPNLVWIFSAEAGKLVTRSEATTQTTNQEVAPGENDDEEIVTTTVVTVVIKKKINTIHNTVNQ